MKKLTFDPRFHPRDRRGLFAKKLGQLEPGDSLVTQDGFKLTRATHPSLRNMQKFHVERAGKRFDLARGTDDAVRLVFNESAKSGSPDSLGGSKRFTSYEHFEQREQKVAKQRENIRKARRGPTDFFKTNGLPKP